ncbi:transposase-like protein DUF772 [Palleronia aestuarii]|uniref:Transposase-like protein DUF772 n=1 Tax=Palleronia aestuarii TaxID=568105 RepID=A0A2W7MWN3_9RHOB|nr:transposase-like protein DUF772 [Palleronia aestuarii]
MRFCGLGIADAVPDANTLWDFREAFIRANALDALLSKMDMAINQAGFITRSGQIVGTSLVAAPRQRNTDREKAAIKAGKCASEIWPDKLAKAAQKDVDGRWTVKYSKAKVRADVSKPVGIAIPLYGYKSHVSIDRMHGVFRRQLVTDASRHDGTRLREGLIQMANTAQDVWADSAYRSAKNEFSAERQWHDQLGKLQKPHSRPTPQRTSRANGRKSAVRSMVEHVFAQQKARMGLTIRTIGLTRARAAITLANIAYYMTRLRWLQGRTLPA